MIAIILNEAAASGKASRQLGAIENYLAEIDMDCRILRTQHPGHATLLARRCAEEGFETVCAKVPESREPIGEAREINLYPYGCAKLRMTELPLIK